jgi:hypothetical protein
MLSPYIHAALAHERHQAFLAQAETDRRNRQARLRRPRDGAGAVRRSLRRLHPARLRPSRSRLPGHWPGPTVTGRPVVAGALGYEIKLGPAESSEPRAEGIGE